MTAIVLAGGRSTRYGSPKLAAALDGEPLLDHAVRAVTAIADAILVAGAPRVAGVPRVAGARHVAGAPLVAEAPLVAGAPLALMPVGPEGSVPCRWVPDEEPFAGPLAALAGALRETATDRAIVVGGDMPRLVPAVLRSMLQRLDSYADVDAVLLAAPNVAPNAASTGATGDPDAGPAAQAFWRQVLPLALRVETALAAAIEARRAGDRSLVRLLDRVRWIEIPAADWLALDPAGRTLLDVDRPSDLEQIQREVR